MELVLWDGRGNCVRLLRLTKVKVIMWAMNMVWLNETSSRQTVACFPVTMLLTQKRL